MVNIGIVGIGFMGVTHYKAVDKVKGAKVSAICTRDEKKLRGDWRKVQGNFGGGGGVQDLSKVDCYADFDVLLADPKIDLVDICLPTDMHNEFSLKAIAAGKHLLLEKPITVDLPGANRLIAAAKKGGVRFMVAHVLRYFPEFLLIKQLLESGAYGPVLAAHFKRIISRPAWSAPEDLQRTGGPAIDLHIHDVNFIQYLFGMPQAVTAQGYVGRADTVEYQNTLYHFAEGPQAISAEGGWLAQQGCPFEHGYDVYFEEATLKFNSSWGVPPQLLTKDGKVRQPRLPGRDGFVGELQEAVDAVRQERDSTILSGEEARDSLKLCLKEVQAVKSGRKVRV
ncbi:MAG: gfo/Idh/MocA family oxidoreductase [Candidatus Latescibacteria bacterium]|nr:gfo/Idh/MocA family oxidoreductase [Candidatus Latescibacterota bacterium]